MPNMILMPNELTFEEFKFPEISQPKNKLDQIVGLIDSYLWCTRGSKSEDTYSIRDEDDFEDFEQALKLCLDSNLTLP